MVLRKQELTRFLVWMRNGISFGVTWFLILLLAASYALNLSEITTAVLSRMVILVVGGVFLFCVSFTKLFFVRWSFLKRISFFMALLCIYQVAGFYWIGFFKNIGTVAQWGIYAGIVLVLYLCCVLIYHAYYSKKSKIYTQALNEYQKKRGNNHGE